MNYGGHNFIHIAKQTKLSITPYHTSRDGRVALVATCCIECTAQHLRHSTYDFFLYQNAWAR